jgi:hypothetical protein
MQPALIGSAAQDALLAAIERHRRPPLALELARRGLGVSGYGEMLPHCASSCGRRQAT